MVTNKFEFIQGLLMEKKLHPSQRERILQLAAHELDQAGSLEKRVTQIENMLETKIGTIEKPNESHGENKSSKQIDNLPKYSNPLNLYKFLLDFNQNPILRTTCHEMDSHALEYLNDSCGVDKYDFQIHHKKIIEQYNKLQNKHTYAYNYIKALIYAYLNGNQKSKWSSKKIELNWQHPDLLKWVQEYPTIPPNYNEDFAENEGIELLEIPQINSPITYEPIQNFTQLVLHFKNLFHLKSGNQSLKAIIMRTNTNNKWNEKINFEINETFRPNIDYFTDVDKLIQTYNKIIRLIIEQHNNYQFPVVKLGFYEQSENIYLSIHHTNGIYNKTMNDTMDRTGQTYSELIKLINGLCNFYVTADFGNGEYACINLWNGNERIPQKLDYFQGVEHLLEFPKR